MRIVFHIEVERDCLEDEVVNPPPSAQLEAETIEYVSRLFNAPVRAQGRRHDGALVCSFNANEAQVRKMIEENLLTEGNDQIVAPAYVIVRDFEFE